MDRLREDLKKASTALERLESSQEMSLLHIDDLTRGVDRLYRGAKELCRGLGELHRGVDRMRSDIP